MKTDQEIARSVKLKEIGEIAESAGMLDSELERHGRYKAKLDLSILRRLSDRPDGRYIMVTAITPTPLGEGKTVTNISLAQGLARIGKKVINTLRQPSMGPVFGVKGGATGGGRAQVVPMEEINLHFTGDIHAVAAAHNLLAAMLDNSLYHGNLLGFDPKEVYWNRTVDMNDRTLRQIVIGLGGTPNGITRESGFDITAASEVMAILALAEGYADLKRRLGSILVGASRGGKPIWAHELKAQGAMTALLRDALKPNLVQTLEGTPCLMHAGPFANVAHGNNSIIADRIALKLADYVVTESGFGSDTGAEKFIDIKCRLSGLKPHLAVLVATVRALKMHGGAFKKLTDKAAVEKEDVEAVLRGCCNLEKHIENARLFGLPVVVAINRFPSDTDREIEAVRARALEAGAVAAVPHEGVVRGGDGAVELAKVVVEASQNPADVRFLYDLEQPIEEKIRIIAQKVYGAGEIDLSSKVKRRIKFFNDCGLAHLPICMAKTPASLSHDPTLRGRPQGFKFPVTDIRAAAGAGFIYPVAGDIMTMPGLPSTPSAAAVDVDDDGQITGLF
ncbi:MAG TPA: formate--tetrahydrofolate ligase [Patescibacteria group bacterium]|nr:formate--tetrahydrofolate ligase [Patescibacteria group bacterium]